MNIGQAIEALKAGQRVTREAWNVLAVWLEIQVPDAHSKMTLPYIFMASPQGERVPWCPSQSDVFAEDWRALG